MGGPPQPERPKRQRSRDPNCARYVSGGIVLAVIVFLLGLTCFCGGLFVLTIFFAGLVGLFKLDAELSGLKWILAMMTLMAIGLAHVVGGFLIVNQAFRSPEWIALDRLHGSVRRQKGVLFFRKIANESLDKFTEVSIFPISATWRDSISAYCDPMFEVALTGPNEIRFPIGRVTLSYDLAREYGREVAKFLNLPLS
jgi:hypothetical protein